MRALCRYVPASCSFPCPLACVILSAAPQHSVLQDTDGRGVEGSRGNVPCHAAAGVLQSPVPLIALAYCCPVKGRKRRTLKKANPPGPQRAQTGTPVRIP